MKTKNLLTRISFGALFAAAALLPAALTSCSSDSEPAPAHEDPIPEGMARINLSFATPNVETRTRALSDEAGLDDLYLYIFDSTGALYKLVDAKEIMGATSLTTSYQDIYGGSKDGLPIAPGQYKFFMVANIGDFVDDESLKEKLTDDTKGLTESDITGLSLNFGTNAATLTAKTNNLPMAANCTDVTVTKNSQTTQGSPATNIVTNGVINITDGEYDIKIDMSFLCSAVRYTILFDNSEGGVSQFYKKFEMTSVKAKNMLTSYNMFSSQQAFTSESTATETDALTWNLYKFPTGKTIANLKENPALLTNDEKVDEWTDDDNLRAVQGVVYLPENFATQVTGVNDATSTLKTVLDLSYSLDDNALTPTLILPNTSTTVDNNRDNVLARAHYYDVIGVITSSGIEFYVTVKHWTYNSIPAIPF